MTFLSRLIQECATYHVHKRARLTKCIRKSNFFKYATNYEVFKSLRSRLATLFYINYQRIFPVFN